MNTAATGTIAASVRRHRRYTRARKANSSGNVPTTQPTNTAR